MIRFFYVKNCSCVLFFVKTAVWGWVWGHKVSNFSLIFIVIATCTKYHTEKCQLMQKTVKGRIEQENVKIFTGSGSF